MKCTSFLSLAWVACASLGYASGTLAAASKTPPLADKTDRISYSIGVDIGRSLDKQKIAIHPDLFLTGVKDGLANQLRLMSEEEIQKTMGDLQTELFERHKADFQALSQKNKSEGEAFLTKNGKKKDVITLPSGLQYRIITPGKGDSPKPTDTVTVHYRGKLLDGTEFDSSYSRGEPAHFVLQNVIPGWTEALQHMKPGAKWELFIPPQLAYKEQGISELVGPNATLVFEVELLEIKHPNNDQNDQGGTAQKTQ